MPTFRLRNYVLLFFLVIASVLTFSPARAQQPTPSADDVNAIARQLYCPICENTPLDVCPTDACRDWRELIRQMLAQGQTPDAIKQYFVDHYGARVLSEPPRSGLNLLVYIVPPLALLIGAFLLFMAIRTWMRVTKRIPGEATPLAGSVDRDEYAARFEEELQKRK